jgi:hypothetical protein
LFSPFSTTCKFVGAAKVSETDLQILELDEEDFASLEDPPADEYSVSSSADDEDELEHAPNAKRNAVARLNFHFMFMIKLH